MKTKTVQETVTRTVYVAEDGQTFGSAKECRDHETNVAEMAYEERADSLPQFELDYPNSYNHSYKWFLVSNGDDYRAIVMTLYNSYQRADIPHREVEEPVWMLFSCDEDGYGYPIGTFKEVENELMDYISDVREAIQKRQ